MSMDNGHIIRKNADGKFVLQQYSMSVESYPDITKARPDQIFDTLEDAIEEYNGDDEYPDGKYCDEYGLTIDLKMPTPS
jgi:hypothetical protein